MTRRAPVAVRLRAALGVIFVAVGLVAGAAPHAASQTAPIVGVRGDASSWRMIDGEGVVGVMGAGPFLNLGQVEEMTPEQLLAGPAAGYFVVYVEGRGFFEGLYNFKKGGRAAAGVFWPEGRSAEEVVTGFIDLEALEEPGAYGGTGKMTFTDDGFEVELSAR